jgi:transglutaminase-like putative cysteine protease
VKAILEWLIPGKNLRFGGKAAGSRHGVAQVLQQGFGHCWDFSDCCVALCRASGIPCRQVAGWLHGGEGHVWSEVLIQGQGWVQIDPTAGMPCGSDYIPYLVSEDGEMPLVYLSAVRVEVLEPN